MHARRTETHCSCFTVLAANTWSSVLTTSMVYAGDARPPWSLLLLLPQRQDLALLCRGPRCLIRRKAGLMRSQPELVSRVVAGITHFSSLH